MHLDRNTLVVFGALVVAVILHEISHGVVALWFGDDTAKRAGRLTLNPIPHIDLFGSIILPALGALSGAAVIGWAKPVPVNPSRLRNPRKDMLVVSLAGPTTNFLLAGLAALAARLLFHGHAGPAPLALEILFQFATVNVLLGVFNFLPIPPLDGAALIERFLPQDWLPKWYQFRQYGFLVLFLLVFTFHIGDRVVLPVEEHILRFILR